MRNKLFLIMFSISLLFAQCVFALPESNVGKGLNAPELQNLVDSPETNRQLIDEMNNSVKTRPRVQNIEENTVKSPYQRQRQTSDVVPKLHNELFDVALMFLKVMLAVAVASLVIYFLLIFVKKYFGDNLVDTVPDWDNSEVSLKTPKNDSSALKNFLNQTKNHKD